MNDVELNNQEHLACMLQVVAILYHYIFLEYCASGSNWHHQKKF